MAEDSARPPSSKKLGKVLLQPGQPLQFADVVDVRTPEVALSSIGEAICNTFRAYSKAARNLLEGKYADRKDLAPPHMRGACNIFIVHCRDGIFVRYDPAFPAPSTAPPDSVQMTYVRLGPDVYWFSMPR